MQDSCMAAAEPIVKPKAWTQSPGEELAFSGQEVSARVEGKVPEVEFQVLAVQGWLPDTAYL